MRRAYVDVSHFRSPFDSPTLSLTGLGSLSTRWKPGRSYVDVAHFRAPYDQGYFQNNQLFGLGEFLAPVAAAPALQPVLIEIYRRDPMASTLCERFVDLDEGLQEWRYRHVKMVQRTIGGKRGTGGSEGAAYLMTTLNQPVFPDLWAIRTELGQAP